MPENILKVRPTIDLLGWLSWALSTESRNQLQMPISFSKPILWTIHVWFKLHKVAFLIAHPISSKYT